MYNTKLPRAKARGSAIIYRVGRSNLRLEAYLQSFLNSSWTNWTLGPMMT